MKQKTYLYRYMTLSGMRRKDCSDCNAFGLVYVNLNFHNQYKKYTITVGLGCQSLVTKDANFIR